MRSCEHEKWNWCERLKLEWRRKTWASLSELQPPALWTMNPNASIHTHIDHTVWYDNTHTKMQISESRHIVQCIYLCKVFINWWDNQLWPQLRRQRVRRGGTARGVGPSGAPRASPFGRSRVGLASTPWGCVPEPPRSRALRCGDRESRTSSSKTRPFPQWPPAFRLTICSRL